MTNTEGIRKDYHSLVTELEGLIRKWENHDDNSGNIIDLREVLNRRNKTDLPTGLVSTEKTGVQSLGNGRYRLSTDGRSAVTGRFNKRKTDQNTPESQ